MWIIAQKREKRKKWIKANVINKNFMSSYLVTKHNFWQFYASMHWMRVSMNILHMNFDVLFVFIGLCRVSVASVAKFVY